MGIASVIWSILITIAVAVLAEAVIGCLWPSSATEQRILRTERRHSARSPVLPAQWPSLESCAEPERPLTIREAHQLMQTHRGHSCARKRAAFAILVAEGRIVPDSTRQVRGWRRWWQ